MLRALSDEFGVSERTLQRDFHQRLSHLDLISDKKGYRLSGRLTTWRTPDIFIFLQKVGLADSFPKLTRKTVNNLINSDIDYPCLAWLNTIKTHANSAECFYRIIQGITSKMHIYVHSIERDDVLIAPYRLALQETQWYLIGCELSQLSVISLNDIQSVQITKTPFQRRKDISHLSSKTKFIQSLPHFTYIQQVIMQLNNSSSFIRKKS